MRVSFYQGAQAQSVSPPPAEDTPSEASLAMPVAAEIEQNAGTYNRQASTESGWDNPFRPDGDLSREADEIVNLIKGGQPITPTPGAASPVLQSVDEGDCEPTTKDSVSPSPVAQSPEAKKAVPVANSSSQPTPKVSVNGTRNGTAPETRSPGQVDVLRTTPQEPQQAEHVVIKKKPRCKCCVIQ